MLNRAGVPTDIVERALKNSRDRCQACRRKFDRDEYRQIRRVSRVRSWYDANNVKVVCFYCSRPMDALEEWQMQIMSKER